MSRTVIWICSAILMLLAHTAYGTIDTVGYQFESTSVLDSNAQGVFLLDDLQVPRAVIFNFSAYCVRPKRSVWFQVWRPVDIKAKVFRLVGQAKLTTNAVPTHYQKRLYTRDEVIFTEEGDRLAIYHEEDSSPVAYTFVPPINNPVYRSSTNVSGELAIGSSVTFLDLEFPFRFSVSVTYDTDIENYQHSGTMIPPTIPPTQRLTIPAIPPDHGTIRYIGNSLTSRDSMMTSEARGSYLLRHIVFKKGVVTSFVAYFMRREPVWFQVWRPISTLDGLTYMLVDQVRFLTNWYPSREQLTLEIGNYIFTEDGDVMGFLVEGDLNPIGFSWIYNEGKNRPLGGRLQRDDVTQYYPGFNLTFSNVELPYDFAAGATYDTAPTTEMYGTPRPILVTTPPTTTTTTPKSTTIPELVKSPSIGQDTIRYTSRYLKELTRKTFIIGDNKFPESALVTSFYAYFVNDGRVQLQVWRELPNNRFKLIGMKNYYNNKAGYVMIPLSESDQIRVAPGDCIGYYNDDPDLGTIGYHFEASNLYYNDSDFTFLVDRTIPFEQMPLPYKFAIAASYTPVPDTTTPDNKITTVYTTECINGVGGGCGKPGGGKTGQSSAQTDEPFGWLLNTRILLVLFAWLIVLTLLFVILCGVMLCREQSKQTATYRQRPYSFTNPVTSSRPTSFNRWDDIKLRDDEHVEHYAPATSGQGNGRQDSRASQSYNTQTTDSTDSLPNKNNNSTGHVNTSM